MISGSCLAVRGLTAEGKIYFFCLEVRFVLGVGGGVGGGPRGWRQEPTLVESSTRVCCFCVIPGLVKQAAVLFHWNNGSITCYVGAHVGFCCHRRSNADNFINTYIKDTVVIYYCMINTEEL